MEVPLKSANMLVVKNTYKEGLMKGYSHMKNKVQKGMFGYLSYKKKMSVVMTIGMFALSLAIFVMGYVTTKTNANLLTVVAVLGCLPASKSAVSMIMFLKAKGCSEEDKNEIESVIGSLDGYYDLYFTGYSKNFPTDHLVVTKNSIIAYSVDKKITEKEFNEHMKDILNKERIHDITVKLFTDRDKYVKRLKELNQSEADTSARNDMVSMLFNVSL